MFVLYLMLSGEYSNELHAAGIPKLLVSLVTELPAENVDCIQVCWLEHIMIQVSWMMCHFCILMCVFISYLCNIGNIERTTVSRPLYRSACVCWHS